MRIYRSRNGKYWKSSRRSVTASSVFAAGEDEVLDDNYDVDLDLDSEDIDDDFSDSLDDVADTVEDIQDSVDEIEQDDVTIETNNNIDDHYIAECDTCHGIFISAVVKSDQDIEKVSGVCPLCGKESEQYLKWVIQKVEYDGK